MATGEQILSHARERSKVTKPGPVCSACNLPPILLAAINKAYMDGLGQVHGLAIGIHDYLVKKAAHPEVTYSSLRNHFWRRHHENAR